MSTLINDAHCEYRSHTKFDVPRSQLYVNPWDVKWLVLRQTEITLITPHGEGRLSGPGVKTSTMAQPNFPQKYVTRHVSGV